MRITGTAAQQPKHPKPETPVIKRVAPVGMPLYLRSKQEREDDPAVRPMMVQAKATVGSPNDPFEREADQVAGTVMRMPEPQAGAQSTSLPASPSPVRIQRLSEFGALHSKKQPGSSAAAGPCSAPVLTSSGGLDGPTGGLGGGRSLSEQERSFFEPRFGRDFSNVKVHTGSEADRSARSINAQAYTKGNDIVFADGNYSQGSKDGQRLMAHELAHVVQQSNATTPEVQRNPDAQEVADQYEADALEYFWDELEVELRTAAAIEGAAIGRRASSTAAQMVVRTCEPFERDQETDTRTMITVFGLSGGAANMSRAFASGPKPGASLGSGGINIASRIINTGLNLVAAWMPTLAGYRTVGSLKDAAVSKLSDAAADSGETSAPEYQAYESDVMQAMSDDWQADIDVVKGSIMSDRNPEVPAALGRFFWRQSRLTYLEKLRRDYGSRSTHAEAMVRAITDALDPALQTLAQALEAAKVSRQRWQAAGSFFGGIAGGAALGAGIGFWGGAGFGAVPGAIGGGIVGGVIGGIGAISILSD